MNEILTCYWYSLVFQWKSLVFVQKLIGSQGTVEARHLDAALGVGLSRCQSELLGVEKDPNEFLAAVAASR